MEGGHTLTDSDLSLLEDALDIVQTVHMMKLIADGKFPLDNVVELVPSKEKVDQHINDQ